MAMGPKGYLMESAMMVIGLKAKRRGRESYTTPMGITTRVIFIMTKGMG